MVKLIVVILLLVIVASLGSALLHLVREPHGSKRMAKALTWRIGLSVGLFLLLLLGYATGVLTPTGLPG